MRELNVRPLLARTADQAVEMLEVHSPDLIVVDVTLRETNVLDVCTKMFEEFKLRRSCCSRRPTTKPTCSRPTAPAWMSA